MGAVEGGGGVELGVWLRVELGLRRRCEWVGMRGWVVLRMVL